MTGPMTPANAEPPGAPPHQARAGEPLIPFYETEPASITWHKIWDHELDSMTNIARPIVLGISTTLVGATLGLVPSFAAIAEKMGEGAAISSAEGAILMCFGACAAGAAAFGFFAIRGQLDAQKVKRDVRNRSPRQINQGTSVA